MNRMVGAVLLVFAVSVAAWAGSTFECNFNNLAEGQIDGQPGWEVFDKVKDSSALSVATEVGTTEATQDKALIVKSSNESIRCITDEPIRWLRKQTASVEFDFRVVVPKGKVEENRSAMVLLLGNSVLNEKASWMVHLDATTNGTWQLIAALPDEASQSIPVEKLAFTEMESTLVSGWLHCIVSVEKLSAPDSFSSSVTLLDSAGETVASLTCSDSNKDKVTKAMWNLSRLHAGFMASKNLRGLSCIDNFQFTTEP